MPRMLYPAVVLTVLAISVLFNGGLVEIRFDEIRYLLGAIAARDEATNTFGIVSKYELIKRRMQEGEDNADNYEFEARMQALASVGMDRESQYDASKKYHLIPVRLLLNGIRSLLGKPIINTREEDEVFNILEIGYFWERNRRYLEALKIYDEVLGGPQLVADIRAAVLVHKAFCYSMLSRYDQSKKVYEQVITMYPGTDAGILSWKLLEFIHSMENERERVRKAKLSDMEKARQFHLLMDFRNAIRSYSVFLSEKQSRSDEMEARFYKGRSHEELGEIEEAMLEYRTVIRKDASKLWARQANRRMLMLGEFYNQQKTVTEEAKRLLEAYQDQLFFRNIEKYSSIANTSSLRGELVSGSASGAQGLSVSDSILKLIDQIDVLESAAEGENVVTKKKSFSAKQEFADESDANAAAIRELKRRQYLAENPYRRPSALKGVIDANSGELRYIYNKRLRSGMNLSGKMVVEIHIKADGSVGETKLNQSNMGDSLFELSILRQIQTWKFRSVPDSLGEVTVNYPFEFYEED